MRKIVFKTFIIVLGLSIVPLKADAQFFKKLFGKKTTDVASRLAETDVIKNNTKILIVKR